MQYCYLNGDILPEDEAKVGILDIGLLRGFGVYEALALVQGKIFRFEDHVNRFKRTAAFLHIQVPVTDEELQKIILDLVEKNGLSGKRVNVKCILTGGKAIGGIEFDPTAATFYIFLEEWKALDPKYYSDGASVITHEHLRHYPQYKTTNYITASRLQKEMRDADALEILYTWQDKVLECATSNFFIIKDSVLVTAKENVLAGVTRNVVIELAKKNNVTVEERDYSLNELFSADECFLTSSFKDVVPVVTVGEKTIGNGSVGQMTKEMIRFFAEYLKAY